jgi:hypothetical protein
MMLRNLLHEIVRRRLWPIPAIALLVALVAPVMFLKSAPAGAPSAQTAVPAPAAPGKLPARAQRLLDANAAAAKGRTSGSQRDPFQAPSSHRIAAAGAAAGAAAPAAAGSATKPVAVVIQNSDGSTPATSKPTATTPAPGSATGTGAGAGAGAGATTVTDPSRTLLASVDVRFGKAAGGRVHRAIPRLKPFFIHGKLAAVFVKYSPSRSKAVFAVAPGLLVTGPVKCRRVAGVCRYVDIPNGSFARLTTVTRDRIVVSRRLDVAAIHTGAKAGTTAVAASDAGTNGCLLRELKSMKPGDALFGRDACEG